LNRLKILRIDCVAEITTDIYLSEFLGNAFRGAFGRALVRLFCKKVSPDCKECEYRTDCAYGQVFKIGELSSNENGALPNPYSVKVRYNGLRQHQSGEQFPFTFLLFGSAIDFADDVCAAICCMFKEKLADMTLLGLQKTELTWQDTSTDACPTVSALTLDFITPTQIMLEKKHVTELTFESFLKTLLQRISTVTDSYGETNFILPYSLSSRIPHITTTCDLRSVEINQGEFSIKGFLGTVRFSGDLTKYMPYIALGSMLHIGKMTTRGCGEYLCEIQ